MPGDEKNLSWMGSGMGVCRSQWLVSPHQTGGMLEVTPLCSCHLCSRAGLGQGQADFPGTSSSSPRLLFPARFSNQFGPWESTGSVLLLEDLAGLCLPRKLLVRAAGTTCSLMAAGHPSILLCLIPAVCAVVPG